MWNTNLNESKTTEKLKKPKDEVDAFAVVHAESAVELCKEDLVPIYEEYDKRNTVGKDKTFRMLPRKFATILLKIEGNAMFPEDQFTEPEREVLDSFVDKKHLKSAKVAGKTFYFDLDSGIKKYLIFVLGNRN